MITRTTTLPRHIAALALALALLAGQASAADAEPKFTGPDIVVGEYGSFTGELATFGKTTHEGILLAVEQRNAKGGVLGRRIDLVWLDTQGKNQEAGTAVGRLIDQKGAVAILGEVASRLSLAGGEIAQARGVPMISPSSTNPKVTRLGDKVFRVCFIDPFQGMVVAKFTRENLKLGKVAILYDQKETYSTGLRASFNKSFKAMGGEIVLEEAYSGGDSDMGAQLTKIRASGAQAIFLPGYYNDVANIAIQARKLEIAVPLLGCDGWESPKLLEIGGKALEGCYFSNHASHEDQRKENVEFNESYRKRWGTTPGALAALGFDAANILFAAMEKSKSLKGDDLAAAIAATSDFPGVTGKITLDAERNAKKSAVILGIVGGKEKYIATIDPPK